MNSFYGDKNLFQFKKKFAPRWEGRYLIHPQGADLPCVVLALTQTVWCLGRRFLPASAAQANRHGLDATLYMGSLMVEV